MCRKRIKRDEMPTSKRGCRLRGVFALGVLLTLGLIQPAYANIYWFTDENGTIHFSNIPVDKRYVTFSISNTPRHEKTKAYQGGKQSEKRLKLRYGPLIDGIAQAYELESALIHAVVSAESAYNTTAISKKGAVGLMQLMPETARRYGATDRFDPIQNLHAGTRYLSDLLKIFDGNLSLALAAYNAGENSVIKYKNQIPPFPETRTYVPRVLDLYYKYRLDAQLTQLKQGR